MSWDVFIQDLPDVVEVDDIPEEFCPKPIGMRTDLIRRIKEIVPMTDFSDPSWGTLTADCFNIEFNMGDIEEIYCIACHIRGNKGGGACVANIVQHLGLRALDSGTGEFFDLNNPELGFEIWKSYRDKVINDNA